MPSRLVPVAAVAAALLTTLAAAGCGEAEIDVDKASKLIDGAVEKQVGVRVAAVDCPATVKVKAKATFKCVVTGTDGTKGDANVTQNDDEGNMTFNAPFLHTREAERIMQQELRWGTRATTVSCPEIIVVKKGGLFECEAKAGKVTRKVAARQTDASGNFRYRVAR